jgi:protein-S-isoprenylcysteine O-methyltransferase Ste14
MPSWSRVAQRIRVPLGFVAAAAYLWLARPRWSSIAAGAALAAGGIAIRALASGHVRKNQELTTSGPYACTRNPLYLGSMIMAAGFALAARSGWVVALALALFFAIYLPVIRAEEAFLRSKFPEYAGYAARVPRILPRLSAISRAGSGFSLELYLKHREYNSILGALALVVALVAKLIWWG